MSVTIPVLELWRQVDSKLDKIREGLDAKAEVAELAALGARVAVLEKAEEARTVLASAHRSAIEWRRWIIPVLLTVIVLVLGYVIPLATAQPR